MNLGLWNHRNFETPKLNPLRTILSSVDITNTCRTEKLTLVQEQT